MLKNRKMPCCYLQQPASFLCGGPCEGFALQLRHT